MHQYGWSVTEDGYDYGCDECAVEDPVNMTEDRAKASWGRTGA